MAFHLDYRVAEARLRIEIASCTRILVAEGGMDYSGHVSARLPDGDTFLIQPMATPRGELRPEDLIEVGLDGRARGFGQGVTPPAELYIHSQIYRARRDVLVESFTRAGWPIPSPKASMFAWAPIPEQLREMGSLEFSLQLINAAHVAVAPGAGFGEQGDGHVRIALVENEQRIRQAARNIRKFLQARGIKDIQPAAAE